MFDIEKDFYRWLFFLVFLMIRVSMYMVEYMVVRFYWSLKYKLKDEGNEDKDR